MVEDGLFHRLRLACLPARLQQDACDLSYPIPTSGLIVLLSILVMTQKTVSLFGFDFYRNEAEPHYFSGHDLVFLGHDVRYEAFLVERVLPGLM